MVVIVRFAEIGLKGKNRIQFEKKLIMNIRAGFQAHGLALGKIHNLHGRILIETDQEAPFLQHIFGVASWSNAIKAGDTIDDAYAAVKELITLTPENTFKVACQRVDKTFPLTSVDVNYKLGEKIINETGAKVDIKTPQHVVYCEIIQGSMYVFIDQQQGPGGLPVGITGQVAILVQDQKSSYAAYLMLKRGCSLVLIQENEPDEWITHFSHGHKVRIEKSIEDAVKNNKVKAIVVADTADSITEYESDLPIFRPLVGMTKDTIQQKLDNAIKIM